MAPPSGSHGSGGEMDEMTESPGMLSWDAIYRRRGCLWAGSPPKVPDLPDGSSVLEIGCGNGKTLSAILCRPWKVSALDISTIAVRMSRETASIYNANPDLLIADVCTLPYKENSFDAVLAFHVTGHALAPDRARIAAEVTRVLAPAGRLFFREFSIEDMRAGCGAAVEERTWSRRDGVITHYFTESDVPELFWMLEPVNIETERWHMRIRGKGLVRAEVAAEMRKMTVCCNQN